MTLTFTTSYAWAGDFAHGTGAELVFDVITNPEDWLVMGRKKGQYSATVSKTSAYRVQLICVGGTVEHDQVDPGTNASGRAVLANYTNTLTSPPC